MLLPKLQGVKVFVLSFLFSLFISVATNFYGLSPVEANENVSFSSTIFDNLEHFVTLDVPRVELGRQWGELSG